MTEPTHSAPSLAERFMNRVLKSPDGCWLWQGYRIRAGYGTFRAGGKTHIAHRLSYELFRGLIPAGHHLDHLCLVRQCVRPDHLEAVTPRVNVLRSTATSAVHARQTHCVHGHPFDEENTYVPPGSRRRQCRKCRQRREGERRR
jgi:hypothetical protein